MKKQNLWKIWILAVTIVLLLAGLDLSGQSSWTSRLFVKIPALLLTPLQNTSRLLTKPLKNLFSLRTIYIENAELKSKIAKLEQDLAELEETKNDNEQLQAALGFKKQTPKQLVACSVLSRDPSGIVGSLILDCGENAGVKIGMGMISQGYLAGRIILTGKDTSTALILTAPTTAIDASIPATKTYGLIRGSFGSGLILDLIPTDSNVSAGDLVTTAGINTNIPPGILIGRIDSVLVSKGELFKHLTVISPVNYQDIRRVQIIIP